MSTRPSSPLLGVGWSALIALAAGALSAAPLPGVALFPLIAVTALTLLVDGGSVRRAALIGFGFGVGWFGVWLTWLDVIGVDAWIGLTVVCALAGAATAIGVTLTLRLRWGVVLAPTVWILIELIRSSIPFGGFPWARLASGVEPAVPLDGVLIVGGLPFAGALIALVGTAVARCLRTRSVNLRAAGAVAIVVAVVLIAPLAIFPAPTTDDAPEGDASAPSSITVALVQGNVPGEGLDFLGRRRQVLNNHLERTLELARELASDSDLPRPDLVVWPENSSDIDPFTDSTARDDIDAAVKELGIPVLLGAVVTIPDDRSKVRNAAILWDPETGPEIVYDKRRPVPFGEFIPFRATLSRFVERLDRVPRDFIAGDSVGVIDVAGAQLGVVICFEIAADDVVRDAVNAGGEALLVLTNNATYSLTDQPDQQFAVTRLRAVEHRRSTAVAATTGITAAVAPDGSVIGELPTRTSGVLTVALPLNAERTPSARVGFWVSALLAIVGVVACLAGAGLRRRSTATPSSSPSPNEFGESARQETL